MARTPNRTEPVESVYAREQLERRWFTRMKDMTALASLVTGERNRMEPYHRWFAYKQAFAPQLVREFLRQSENFDGDLPLLDPFSGSGTVAIEAARYGIPAIGIEALSVLAFIARQRAIEVPPTMPTAETLDQAAEGCADPTQQLLLLLAASRQHDSDGRPLKQPPPFHDICKLLIDQITADLEDETVNEPDVRQGDARTLDEIPDASIGGILTSPPYLSRHDYTRITRALSGLYARWYPDQVALDDDRALQIKAHPRARESKIPRIKHPAVEEVVATLRGRKEQRLARIVNEYFADMRENLRAAHRVLVPDAPMWLVIGGANLAEVYIPGDLIVLELAEREGFEARRVFRARDLHRSGRQLGGLTGVAPRETLLMLRKGNR